MNSYLTFSQQKEVPKRPDILIFEHLIIIEADTNGLIRYLKKSDTTSLESNGDNYIIVDDYLNVETDVVNSYVNTGIKEAGIFKKGYKTGFWKTTYKNKLVKTENWRDGLLIGKYRVYDTIGNIVYQTNFKGQGNGLYKDYHYKTGIIREEGNYKNGKKEGEWRIYKDDGTLKDTLYYRKGNTVKN